MSNLYALQLSAADSCSHSESTSCGSGAKANEPVTDEVSNNSFVFGITK